MEEKEKDLRTEVLSERNLNDAKESLEQRKEEYQEEGKVDIDKVQSILESFRGANNITAMCAISSSFLLMHPVLLLGIADMLKSAIRTKMTHGLIGLLSETKGEA